MKLSSSTMRCFSILSISFLVLWVGVEDVLATSPVEKGIAAPNGPPDVNTISVPYGSRIEMECLVHFEEPITPEWKKLGGQLPRNSQTSANKLILDDVKAEDSGTYICAVNNVTVSQSLVVTV